MPRTINAVLEAIKNQSENMPIELYQIYLDEEILYLACYPEDINFFDENGNPQTYYAAALSRTAIKTNTDTEVDKCEVSIDNVTREMSAYIANTEFVGRRMVIWKVFLDDLSSADNYVPIFDGIMDAPKINQYQMTVTVVSKLDILGRKLPARIFQVQCPWQFGEPDTCGATAPTKSGTVDSLSADYMTINDADITEAAGYWEHGEITIGKESRTITGSGSGYVTVEYPFSANIQAGDSYSMKAGCDKSYDGGHGCTFWGNTQFYGGFLSIPEIRDVREVG